MAPSTKRKNVDDDFILTISDNEADIPEEVIETVAPPKKKAKTVVAKNKKSKKSKKGGKAAAESHDEEADAALELDEGPGGTGIWGQADEDDGAMDSDFEFVVADNNTTTFDGLDDTAGDFAGEGWGFEGARKGVTGAERRVVDVDDIIKRRKEKKELKLQRQLAAKGGDAVAEAAATAAALDRADAEMADAADAVGLDDDDDEVLAEDGFGMGVGSDDDDEDAEWEEEKEGDDQDEEDDAASDNDSVATPVQHPDDVSGSEDEGEDAEEEARRKEFFAPEEKEEPGSKKNGPTSFHGMSLSRPILRGLAAVGFTKPTPIQAKAIPIALMGKDVVGGAVTGSGKTAAFVVPILERLLYRPKKLPTTRVVILMPTRELAIQCHSVAVKLASHTDIKFCLAVGGLSLKVQEAELRLRPDVVIATPGRFIDHMRNSPSFSIDTVEILVLDEADRMLEDGFADELNEIMASLNKSRQTMLFSATMTSNVDRLIRAGLTKPVRIMVDTQKRTVGTLVQEFVRLRPGREEKRMGHHLLQTEADCSLVPYRIRPPWVVVCGTPRKLEPSSAFRDGKVSYLLATDLASRGLDIKGVDTVINYEAPQTLEVYVHRVGRTARAGRTGVAVTLAAEPDRKVVKAAVRQGKAQGAKIVSRVIEATEADKWQAQIDDWEDEIQEILNEEKEEKHLAQIEMQVTKGENMIKHEKEINARPRRTWFETEADKKAAKEAGRAELNGDREKMKKKGEGKLSNKDKKKLDSKAERKAGEDKVWKKGRAERDGKGAVLNFKKDKSEKKAGGGKPKPKGPPNGKRPLLRYLFPAAIRDRYRERVLGFRLDTLPSYKHSLQGSIYRFLVERQRRRREQTRLGPMTRRNRMLIGLARRLSGIPAPTIQSEQGGGTTHEEHERMKEEKRIAKEARDIERRGRGEERVAERGGYSETPREDDSEGDDPHTIRRSRSGATSPVSAPGSPTLAPTKTSTSVGLTEAELAVANANLMARIGPFMTTPLVQLPITIFFYNDNESQSRTVMTDDSGHFVIRAALDFVPTNLRVLANENISMTMPIEIIEPRGVSLISDIDDTIKRSNIHLGAREIFRNTFIRDLADLTIDGVKEWYHKLHDMGVKVHYCSNSPWQLFPVLATYFLTAGLPPGSIHLKHYSGMLQGIFEPVAERKKGTLERILRDFPERKFLLVGDSGEADLEVYTDLVVAHPGRILAVFIRDVTTPDQPDFFDNSYGQSGPGQSSRQGSTRIKFADQSKADSEPSDRPILPPRVFTAPQEPRGPAMGTLIDFSDEPEQMTPTGAGNPLSKVSSYPDKLRSSQSALGMLAKKPPPPRPAKPTALRTNRNAAVQEARRPSAANVQQNNFNLTLWNGFSNRNPTSDSSNLQGPPPPPPRRRGTPSSLRNFNVEPLSNTEAAFAANSGTQNQAINKKLDLWRRRLARAHEALDERGVALYTWRKGDDVIAEAEGIVREAQREMERSQGNSGGRGR
ncbi:hypothetical protein B0H63DRAFT_504228 [Podospora didyma]|uniref:ATP-dependent RNA helicase n=1 Tax=Podospora didyma TaxID=330526 RepID=A0AAE0K278_9PEZI|nr:hypothetical protein B0H63DRAFT_504228 [Podospora didyma]